MKNALIRFCCGLCFTLIAVAILSGCGTVDPVWREYRGKLSDESSAEVLEAYTDCLVYAYVDADGDGTLDFFVGFDDKGESLDFISGDDTPLEEHVRATPGCFYSTVRPQGLGPSALLEGIYSAAQREARTQSLALLYISETSETDRWLLTVELRNGGALTEQIKAEAFQQLVSGTVTMQSAFVLSGYGEQGLALLGKALRQTRDKKAARDAAIYLSDAGASAAVALPDLVASLHRHWRNTRHCVLSAVLNIAEADPQAVAPYMSQIGKYANHRDSDIRYKVHLMRQSIENAKPKPSK